MEPAPLLVTINEPLNLPCACVELEAIDRGISLHGCDNIGRVHTSANGFLFALVYRSCGTNSFESTFTCIERFLDANARRALLHTHCEEVLGIQTQPPCCVGKV